MKSEIAVIIALFLVQPLAVHVTLGAAHAASVNTKSKQVVLRVEGMHCNNCSRGLEKALLAQKGVNMVRVSFSARQATIAYNPQLVSIAQLTKLCGDMGFMARPLEKKA